VLWRARSGSAAGSSSEGGWNSTSFNVVPTKMYRFSVWIRCFGANASGSFYLGVGGGTVSDIGGGVNSNPYFLANGRSLLPDSQWVVFDVDTGYNDYATMCMTISRDGKRAFSGQDRRCREGQYHR